jgi:hypothetical protein
MAVLETATHVLSCVGSFCLFQFSSPIWNNIFQPVGRIRVQHLTVLDRMRNGSFQTGGQKAPKDRICPE